MRCIFRAIVEIDESLTVWHWKRTKPVLVRHAPSSKMSFSSEHSFGKRGLYIHPSLYSLLQIWVGWCRGVFLDSLGGSCCMVKMSQNVPDGDTRGK